MVSYRVRWLQGLVKTTKTPNVCVEGILCRRVDYITKRDREAIILPHLQGGLTSLPI